MRLRAILLSIITLLSLGSAGAQSVQVEVKGVRIGMTKAEVTEKLGSLSPKGLVIGCVPSYYAFQTNLPLDPGVQMEFNEDALERFTFLFHSKNFDELLLAFKEKYSHFRCEKTQVQTQAGGKFTQDSCFVEDQQSRLTLSRFAGAVDTGGLVISAKSRIQKDIDARLQKRKEI
jgi:hypothetical protein